ncbi:energy-coupling factor transporter ATPase [Corticicoccus populi]|uniref:Energy-coupling factor transporter ATP-binding protein EcfA2 n=1 Tax=Corticicoccus populi TaxID=1812821 RepID=A0ABW5WWW1_9STAP
MNIEVKQLMSTYNANTPFEHLALNNVSTTFEYGKYYGIIGKTGSGKSTLIQHLNGLLLPSSGEVSVDDLTLRKKTKQKYIHQVKQRVGMVFQFPEHQLFEETVLKDVMFGPLNIGMSKDEAEKKAVEYLHLMNIHEDDFKRSPFDLSGGQMRKVAIAGILAMEPKVLILDEPTAGLDPKSHIETMQLFKEIHQRMGITVILITHDMNDVYEYTDEVKLLSSSRLITEGSTEKILTNQSLLEEYHLDIPHVVRLTQDLRKKGVVLSRLPKNTEEFIILYEEWRDNHAE